MAAVRPRHIDASAGTPEPEWHAWLAARGLPRMAAAQLVGADQRAVVVAPHPDDEVLMVGGLLAQLAVLRRAVVVVAVTDGEASHPGSTRWPAERLARARAAETRQALKHLGSDAAVVRAGVRDGHVGAHQHALCAVLAHMLRPSDVVFTTWSLDGHPDHEATARATQAAAAATGARVLEVPVWGWHWARPDEACMPWSRALCIGLARPVVQRKCTALRAFRTQWEQDTSCQDTPVLLPAMLARAQRGLEIVFG